MIHLRRVAVGALATFAVALVAACSDAGDPTSPQVPDRVALGIRATDAPTSPPGTLNPERFEVCKVWAGVSVPSDFSTTVTVDVTGGTTDNFQVTLTGDQCREVWINGGTTKDNVTVTESGPAGFTTTVSRTYLLDGVAGGPDSGNSGAVDGDSGVLVTWTNTLIPTGGEGCTPGYWKNHAGIYSVSKGGQKKPSSWVGYSPTEYFDDVFGVGPHVTLITALDTGGGGEAALGRHAVAALLSAAHPGIDYDRTVAQVIAMVQGAYASGDFEGVKDTLATFNEQGCPL